MAREKLNTRMAPAPTGPLHIGTARTAMFNWIAARSTGGKFFLRIDDTNPDLCDEKYVDEIREGLEWLGLDWDAEYRQSALVPRYDEMSQGLHFQERAVIEDGALRLDYDHGIETWHDEVSGDVNVSDELAKLARGTVIGTSDGRYTYHFASVVCDDFTNTNLIIRGSDHMNNTVRHLALYDALGLPRPKFAHVGLVTTGTKKMSKSDAENRVNLLDLRDAGYDPDAVFSYLLRLGWAPTVDDKANSFLSRERAMEMFLDEGRMKYKNANADHAKLDWFDRKWKAIKEKAS